MYSNLGYIKVFEDSQKMLAVAVLALVGAAMMSMYTRAGIILTGVGLGYDTQEINNAVTKDTPQLII